MSRHKRTKRAPSRSERVGSTVDALIGAANHVAHAYLALRELGERELDLETAELGAIYSRLCAVRDLAALKLTAKKLDGAS